MLKASKGILTLMIYGLLRISCSRNPKTPQIRSFFYEKWLLFGVFRVPTAFRQKPQNSHHATILFQQTSAWEFCSFCWCADCAPPPQAAQKFVIATTDEHTCADCPTQGEQSAQVCPDVGVRTNSALPVEEGRSGHTVQKGKRALQAQYPLPFIGS